MKKTILMLALALSLVGCATFQKDYNAITGATVSPEAVLVAGNSFDALEATATNYLTFCKANRTLPVCASYVGARKQILPAVRSGRVARNNLEIFLQQNPGQLGPTGLYNTLTSAVATLQGVVAQYSISAAGASK
jgi:hypothetical protein